MLVESLVKFALLGSAWVLYLLFFLSVVSIAAMFERWSFFRKNDRGARGLSDAIQRALEADDDAGLRVLFASRKTIEARVLGDALRFLPGGPSAVADTVDAGLGKERARLEKAMTLLGTLGNNTPFVGLFGTVLGVIEAFSHLGGGDQSQMGSVMSAIAEALVATGVGIFVAIPAVVAYNVAQAKIGAIENEIASNAKLLTAWITTRERGAVARSAAPSPAAPSPAASSSQSPLDARAALDISSDFARAPEKIGASR